MSQQINLSWPIGGSSEHHCQPGHSEGLRFQELQLPARDPPSLPRGLPAPALAGHSSHVSRPWLFPGVYAGRWSPPGQSSSRHQSLGQENNAVMIMAANPHKVQIKWILKYCAFMAHSWLIVSGGQSEHYWSIFGVLTPKSSSFDVWTQVCPAWAWLTIRPQVHLKKWSRVWFLCTWARYGWVVEAVMPGYAWAMSETPVPKQGCSIQPTPMFKPNHVCPW